MSVRTYRRLGELLLDRGAVTYLDLSIALADQKVSKKRLGTILIERGFTPEDEVAACLAQQSGFPLIDLTTVTAHADALRLLPAEQALELAAMPIELTEAGLVVAVSNPTDVASLDRLAAAVNCSLVIHVAGPIVLERMTRRVYGLVDEAEADTFTEQPMAPRRYTDLTGRYRCESTSVYDATDSVLDRPVTLLCNPIGDKTAEEMHSAVKSASMGMVTGVAPIYDSVNTGVYRWTVVPMIHGDCLEAVLRAMGPRSIIQAAEIVSQIAESMDSIERFGGHGSWICPRNVFLTSSGVVAVPVSPLPSNYISPSPEYDAAHPGAGTAYVLGCLLRDCLFGTGGRHDRTIPAAMRTILETALESQPRDRYGSAIEVASALRSFNWQALSEPTAVDGDVHRDRLLHSLDINQQDLYQRPSLFDRIIKKNRAA